MANIDYPPDSDHAWMRKDGNWEKGGGGTYNGPYFTNVYLSADQTSVPSGTWSRVQFDAEKTSGQTVMDITTTKGVGTIPQSGAWVIMATAGQSIGSSFKYMRIVLSEHADTIMYRRQGIGHGLYYNWLYEDETFEIQVYRSYTGSIYGDANGLKTYLTAYMVCN